MLKNYFKTALRFLKHNKVFAAINMMSLSIALAASFIILLFIINELSYDKFNKNRKDVYRVVNFYKDFKKTMSGTPYILSKALKEQFPQVENAITERYSSGFSVKLNEEIIAVPHAMATSSEIFNIFTIKIISGGSPDKLLDDLNSIVLSRDLAQKLFPGVDPVGKEVISYINNEEQMLVVKGVFENIPVNTTLPATCFLNSKWTTYPINKSFNITDAETNWVMDFWFTWVKLAKGCDPAELEKQFRAFEKKNISEDPQNQYSLQNLTDVYLKSGDVANSFITGSMSNVKLFSAIALLIVLVAAINYIILSTAVSSFRGKEIGVRKTFGALNNSIKKQLLSESVLLSVLVLPVSLLLMWLSLPLAGKLFDTKLTIIGSNIITYILVYLVVTVLIGLASGIYTSAHLSGLKVMSILKNATHTGKNRQLFRSFLIVVQLVIFCSFVSATIIIRLQYLYAIKKDNGYFTKDILIIDLGRKFTGYSAYINSIKSSPNVISAAGVMNGLPMQGSSSSIIPNFEDQQKKIEVEGLAVDYNFISTMGIPILKGREFSQDFGSDMKGSVMLNETAVKDLEIKDPLGKTIEGQTIIGIVKDFNLHSLHSDIPPLIISMTDRYIRQVLVHYKPGSINNVLPLLEAEWKKEAPDEPFRYSTIEDTIKRIYSAEKNLSTIITIFALFTLLIAASGLFGLILFTARSRTKEIGVRKVFGSSEKAIVLFFLRNNFLLVLIAGVISVPVTLYIMNKWLSNFAFKAGISWWIFLIGFVIAAVVVMATVFLQSYKASRINPVKALKYE
ncbi:MAG: FtsX-like permease family protein [Bacteroidota bacterium]